MDVGMIIGQIDLGSYALPEFQRGYVWNRDQVKKLVNSLYRDYPVGSLLLWKTKTDESLIRGDGPAQPGYTSLILDGQQRVTSLYGMVKGTPPAFFEGNADAFLNLFFNIRDETFEFYAERKMKDNPDWVSVTEVLQKGIGSFIGRAMRPDGTVDQTIIDRLNQLARIKAVDIPVQEVMGEDKTIDVVVEIFNNVNSGGTKLRKGDLAFAKICAQWLGARDEIRRILTKYRRVGFQFSQDWLLRCVTVYLTGKAPFSELADVTTGEFRDGLKKTEALISSALDLLAGRLGLDHDRVIGSKFSIPILVYYQKLNNGFPTDAERNKLLYWFIHTFLWGRYTAGSVESRLSQDLAVLNDGQGIDGLIRQIQLVRGDLRIKPDDFWGWSVGARFYPMLYMMTRVLGAQDWGSGIPLTQHLLGHNSSLEIHHIFPKAQLYAIDTSRPLVNALANFTFLTKNTNLAVSDRKPEEYVPEYQTKYPGAVASHWIPTDNPELLTLDRYEDFLARRRELLAEAANKLLDSLLADSFTHETTEQPISERDQPVSVADDEETIILGVSEWMVAHGLPEGDIYHSIESDGGEVVARIDIAWPDGVQPGLSDPIALALDEDSQTYDTIVSAGYRTFTDIDRFKQYVTARYLDEPAD